MKKILIAEDEVNIRNLLSYLLTNEGYNVILASDGEEALKKTFFEKPDLLLLDIMMPKRNGYEVACILRDQPEFKSLPIIMLTARGGELDQKMGYATGADEYIAKPFEPSELISTIKKYLP